MATRKAPASKKKARPSQAKKKASKVLQNAKKKAKKSAKKAAKKVQKTAAKASKAIAKRAKKVSARVAKTKDKIKKKVADKLAAMRAPTVLQIGIIHEFGAPRAGIPSRSFIRDWVNENQSAHKEQLRAIGKAVVKGKFTTEIGLKRFGVLAEAQVKKRIASGISPGLKDKTVERKGSSKPLIDTGQLRSSITHKVNRRKPGTRLKK